MQPRERILHAWKSITRATASHVGRGERKDGSTGRNWCVSLRHWNGRQLGKRDVGKEPVQPKLGKEKGWFFFCFKITVEYTMGKLVVGGDGVTFTFFTRWGRRTSFHESYWKFCERQARPSETTSNKCLLLQTTFHALAYSRRRSRECGNEKMTDFRSCFIRFFLPQLHAGVGRHSHTFTMFSGGEGFVGTLWGKTLSEGIGSY